jgi:hypothetical protein
MNMQAMVVTEESVLRNLSETMRQTAAVPGRTAEEAVAMLETHFRGHPHVKGRFSAKVTIWNFPEITFTGEILGTSLTHTIWC